jgi:hypothetical protein
MREDAFVKLRLLNELEKNNNIKKSIMCSFKIINFLKFPIWQNSQFQIFKTKLLENTENPIFSDKRAKTPLADTPCSSSDDWPPDCKVIFTFFSYL